MKKAYVLQDIGPDVQWAIDKIQALVAQDGEDATLLSAEDKRRLQEVAKVRYNTTAYWDEHGDYLPAAGEIIIYSDYHKYEEDGETKYIPGMKIGTGNGYLADLAFFADENSSILIEHITNTIIHTTAEEKARWNNKLNIDDREVVEETLIFNRN